MFPIVVFQQFQYGHYNDFRSNWRNFPTSSRDNGKPFADTAIGILPNAMLVNIGKHLSRHDKKSFGLVCQRFRKVAEEVLYQSINLNRDVRGHEFDEYRHPSKPRPADIVLWLLHRTLSDRPDLAVMVKRFQVFVRGGDVRFKVPTSTTPKYTPQVAVATFVELEENLLAASLVFSIMKNLKHLEIDCQIGALTDVYPPNTKQAFGLVPSRYRTPPRSLGLHHLRSIEFTGRELQHALIQLPTLKELSIGYRCGLRASAPQGMQASSITSFVANRSTRILNPLDQGYEELKSLVAQLDQVSKIKILIKKFDDLLWTNEIGHGGGGIVFGGYAPLVEALEPARTALQKLDLSLASEAAYILKYCFPVESFTAFTSLRVLKIPYEGLFSGVVSPAAGTPRCITTVLPRTLEVLEVDYPNIDIYEWFLPLTTNNGIREQLPVLREVLFLCSGVHNDSYNPFPSLQPHKVEKDLGYRGVLVTLLEP